jgi:hypothetical protein
MSTEFVLFRTAGTNEPEPILINPAHVRTVRQSGSAQVTLVMDDGEGGGYQNVEGDLKSVWEKLTGKVSTLEALDEHLTWTAATLRWTQANTEQPRGKQPLGVRASRKARLGTNQHQTGYLGEALGSSEPPPKWDLGTHQHQPYRTLAPAGPRSPQLGPRARQC